MKRDQQSFQGTIWILVRYEESGNYTGNVVTMMIIIFIALDVAYCIYHKQDSEN